MSDKIVVTLSVPVTAFGSAVTEIELRRPRFRDLRDLPMMADGAAQTPFGAFIPVIAAVSRLPVSAIEDLDIADVGAVMKAFGPLLELLGGQAPPGSPPSS